MIVEMRMREIGYNSEKYDVRGTVFHLEVSIARNCVNQSFMAIVSGKCGCLRISSSNVFILRGSVALFVVTSFGALVN